MMKKLILLGALIIFFIVFFTLLGFKFIRNQPERFQGLGGKPTTMAYLNGSIYIYDSGSGEVYSGCLCPLAGITLTKPIIWVVNPETKSLERTFVAEDMDFNSIKERIENIALSHVATVDNNSITTPDNWNMRLVDYGEDNSNLWADKILTIQNPEGLVNEIRPIMQRMSLIFLDSEDTLYVVSSELVPINNPEDISKYHTGEIGPRVQDMITNTWNRVDDVLLKVDYKTGTIVDKYTFGESRITHPISSYELVFDDGKNLFVKRTGLHDKISDSTIETFTGVFDKSQNTIRPASGEEEYALLSLANWFDYNWIIAARTYGNGTESNPIGNTQLRITDRRTGSTANLALDVPKNILSRLAFGALSVSYVIFILVLMLVHFYKFIGGLALILLIWWIIRRKKAKFR